MRKKKEKINSSAANDHLPETGFWKVPGYNAPFYLTAAIVLLTLAVYVPALTNDFVVGWDDGIYITQNEHIRTLDWNFVRWAVSDTRVASYWHPLTWLSHAVDYAVWGLKPLGHHLTSIILHAINTAVVIWLITCLLKIANMNKPTPDTLDQQGILIIAGITGLLFGIHPIHVESVAWVSQRKDLLYSFFYLLSMISYIHYAAQFPCGKPFYINNRYYAALALFILALCSKPMAVTLPLVLLLFDWYPLNRILSRRFFFGLVLEKIPFIIPGIAVSVISVASQKSATIIPLEPVSVITRFLVVCRGLVQYLWQILAPINLLPLYTYPKDASMTNLLYPLAVLCVIAITITCIFIIRKQPIWLTVWAYFIITVSPVLGFFQHTGAQNMANRYMYLPCLGPFIMAGFGFVWLRNYQNTMATDARMNRRYFAAVLIPLTVFFSFLTVKQIGIWKSTTPLLSYFLKKDPLGFPDAYYIRGIAYRDCKQPELAIKDFSTAISIFPNFTFAYLERGETYRDMNQPDLAVKDFTTAISIDPNYVMAFVDRGEVLLERGLYDQSIEDSSRAISINPDSVDAFTNRGTAYFLKGDIPRAIDEYNKAITKKKTFTKAYLSRGFVLAHTGELDQAIKDYSMALTLDPNLVDIYIRRGDLYVKNGNTDHAISDYKKACDLGSKLGCNKIFLPSIKQP